MTSCQHCHATTQNYLCDNCTNQLTNMLDQIPWLLTELDNRIANLTRYQTGTIGRTARPDELNIIDFDAAETARTIRKQLLDWVQKIAVRAGGRPPAALSTVTTAYLAKWLCANTNHIARQPHAGQLYNDIARLVGTDHQRTGQLVRAINPTQHHLVGPCPTITRRNHNGTPHQCGHMLYADTYDTTVTCPQCHQDINVEDNRRRTAAERDLHTRTDLLDTLTNIDEPVTPQRLDAWIRAQRLRPAGYNHDGTIAEYRIHPDAQPVYSLQRARKLRHRDNGQTHRTITRNQFRGR